MSIKLMYITNKPSVAKIIENIGVERIFIDMEFIGKDARQGGMDTVKSHHTIEDIKNIRKVITKSELLVRCNPIHNSLEDYYSSKEEIEDIVAAGADIIMLPMWKTKAEVAEFIKLVDGRAKTLLLLETKEAAECISEVLELEGIDEIHIGLNDLHLSYGQSFMFEPLADGTVDRLINIIKTKNIPYGFGGIARLGKGMLAADKVITEHYRLGSTRAILSRSFCNYEQIETEEEFEKLFSQNLLKIREFEKSLESLSDDDFMKNHIDVKNSVLAITKKLKS